MKIQITNNLDAVERGIKDFEEKMVEKIVDEIAVIHIIGAFSAGKSRLVRELLSSNQGIQNLLPISSLERQTALPLEITYGRKPRLIRMSISSSNDDFVDLYSFPSREEQMKFNTHDYLLRLEVPEPELLLGSEGLCSAEEGVKRLFLKDMPGWNSGDSFIADNPLAGGLVSSYNVSLVYVVRATGVDSQDDLSRLQAIFEAVETGDAFFHNGFNLVVIVTRADNVTEHEEIKVRITQRLQSLAEKVGIDDFNLTVLCVDFNEKKSNSQAFCQAFWQSIFLPIQNEKQSNAESNWANRLKNWQDDWHVQTKLFNSLTLLAKVEKLIDVFKVNDIFIANINNTRLLGLSQQEKRSKIHAAWVKQIGNVWITESLNQDKFTLPSEHPLSSWWDEYWLKNLSNITSNVDSLVLKMNSAIDSLDIFPK